MDVEGMEEVCAEVGEVDAEVEEADAEVEEADGEVEVTQGEVEELEDEFERIYTTIQDLFQKVDRGTNVGAGDSRFSPRARYIRNTNLAIGRRTTLESSCDGCLFPAMCRNCGVRGDSSIFRCLACSLPVPMDVVPCDVCGNPLLCDDYWCKDCATIVGVGEDGVCSRCGRNTTAVAEDENAFVADTEMN
ncbi:hypothetical protein ACQJBY_027484 [Aegilops geniculata]